MDMRSNREVTKSVIHEQDWRRQSRVI